MQHPTSHSNWARPWWKPFLAGLLCALVLGSGPVYAGTETDALAANLEGDYEAELRITRPLAEQGVAWAQQALGRSYQMGEGVEKDFSQALKWYRLAAEQGLPAAHYALGTLYQAGEGVVQDVGWAYRWHSLAALKGLRVAAKERDALAPRLTSEQITQAQRWVDACQGQQFKGCG